MFKLPDNVLHFPFFVLELLFFAIGDAQGWDATSYNMTLYYRGPRGYNGQKKEMFGEKKLGNA